jgi:hypothetical protein
MPVAKGTWTEMGDELIHKRGGSIENVQEGSKEKLPMYINSTLFSKIVIAYEPSKF